MYFEVTLDRQCDPTVYVEAPTWYLARQFSISTWGSVVRDVMLLEEAPSRIDMRVDHPETPKVGA